MTKPETTVMMTDVEREAYERAQREEVSLKWVKIARDRAKTDLLPGMESWRSNYRADETG